MAIYMDMFHKYPDRSVFYVFNFVYNFGHLGCQNSFTTQECHSTNLPTTLNINQ